MRYIVEANNIGGDRRKVLNKLDDLNIELEVLRGLLRIAHELHFIKASSLCYIVEQIDEVGKMRGGWAKRYYSSNKDN
jgi:hypothetical protein